MSYNSDIAVYKTQIDNDISTQSLPNSIPPDVVGSGYTDLADLLAPYINAINNEAILSGSTVPSSGIGNDLDLYYRTQSSFFELYRKESGAWVLKVSVPFGITLPDGPATLRTFINGSTASVTKGGWFISNAVYNKLTQTNFSVPAADATFYRTDLIYADTSNNILYSTGTPSLTPVDPTLPANTIAVDYVIVPSVASGFDPYLRFGSTTEQNGLATQNDTGALTYAGISIASGTAVNIGACTGYVVNNESVPGDPTLVFVNYAGELNKTVTTVGSGLATYVLLNASGTIVFQNTFPTSAQRKTHIYLSKIGHPAGTITTAGNEVDFVLSPLAQHRDLFQAINYINNGVAPSSAGATLNFALSTGTITGDGINFVVDNTNPNTYTVAPQPTASFLRRTQTGAGGTFVSVVDVANYDVAGTLTAIPGGANVSTIQYIYLVPTLGLIVQYGQTTYASLTDAIAAVGKETFTIYPSLIRNAILVGALAVVKSATALNNTTQARFFLADKFGQLGGASSGISTATLQSAYSNSLQPQIVTTAALGAVQFKRGSAADPDNVFQVLNGAGTATFGVSGEGAAQINGIASLKAGAEALKIGTNTGNPDHAYAIFYARAASPTQQSGLLGFNGVATTDLSLVNYISSGGLLLGANTTTAIKVFGATRNVVIQDGGTFTDDATNKLQVSGAIRSNGGAESLKVGTNTGNADHAFIGLYARTATPTTKSASIGYLTAAVNDLSIVNSISTGDILYGTTGTGANHVFTGSQLSVAPNAAGSQSWSFVLGSADTAKLDIMNDTSINSAGAIIQGRANRNTNPTLAADILLDVRFAGQSTSSSQRVGASIKGTATANFLDTDFGSKLDFFTAANGSTTLTKAMTIDQDGSVTGKFKTLTVAPTTSDIAAGFFMLVKETTGGTLKLYANDGGTIKSVTLT